MHYLNDLFSQIDFTNLLSLLLRVAAVFLCLAVHEASHGLAAYALGDPTAKGEHRLSLNPLRHIDLLGLLMMFFVGFGWAKPVPVDMRYFKNPKSGMGAHRFGRAAFQLCSGVGAAVCVHFMAYHVAATAFTVALYSFLYTTAFLSVGLGTFNLIPIPPLDGSKVLFSFLPDMAYFKLMYYERYGMLLLLALAFIGAGGGFVSALMNTVFRALLTLVGL